MNTNVNISEMTTDQLEILGFREGRKRDIAQNNLNMIFQELAIREQKEIESRMRQAANKNPGNGKVIPPNVAAQAAKKEKRENA